MTMTMTTSQLPSIQNMPRDLAKVASMGVFGHRQLAEQLATEGIHLWATEMEKSAFITADPPVRAQRILGALQQWDSQHGGVHSQQPLPTPMQQPMMQSMMQPMMQMPQLMPQSEPTRDPSNESTKKTRGGNGAEVKAITDQLNLLSVEVAKITTGLSQISTGTDMHIKTVHQHIERLEQRIVGMQQVVHLTLGVVTAMAQNYLGAGGSELVEMAFAQGTESINILAKSGKVQ